MGTKGNRDYSSVLKPTDFVKLTVRIVFLDFFLTKLFHKLGFLGESATDDTPFIANLIIQLRLSTSSIVIKFMCTSSPRIITFFTLLSYIIYIRLIRKMT